MFTETRAMLAEISQESVIPSLLPLVALASLLASMEGFNPSIAVLQSACPARVRVQ